MREHIRLDDAPMFDRPPWGEEADPTGILDGLRGKVQGLIDRRPGACLLTAMLGGVVLGCLRKQ